MANLGLNDNLNPLLTSERDARVAVVTVYVTRIGQLWPRTGQVT